MKEKKSLFPLTLVISILAVAAFAALAIFIAVALPGKVNLIEVLFGEKSYLDFFQSFTFQNTDAPILVSIIGFVLIEILLIVCVILVIVKRKPLFLISAVLFEVSGVASCLILNAGGYSLFTNAQEVVFRVLAYAAFGFALWAAIVTLICLCLAPGRENVVVEGKARVETVEVATNDNSSEAPVNENPVPIEYEAPHAPLSYDEEYDDSDYPDEPAPAPKRPEPVASNKNQKVLGKYEIYPEAGFYKYRLKANNGEILLVSHGYRTRDGVRNGIQTLQKNVPTGLSKIITDKNGFSQFRIFTPNDARLIVAGEFYASSASAQKALASVQRFYLTEKIVDLDEIPENEVREWKVDLPPMNPSKNGKFEVYIHEELKKWQGRLIANNGAVLFVTSTYSSKNAVLNAFASIKVKILAGELDIAKDKQNRYHFRVISENGSVILMGETYPSRESAISAASSVRNFIGDAKIVDLSRGL